MNIDISPCSSIKPIFVAAQRLTNPDERTAYLDEACGEDADLRAKIDGLLAALNQAPSSPLDEAVEKLGSAQTGFPSTAFEEPIDIASHPMVGPYKLLERLGEGGMGAVYMAQQKQPVKRKVALKLIKPGMDSKEVIARFEAERQALAMMDHSNIARIFDGGLTEQGRPYFVMELVRGLPIDEYCDEAKLSLRDRLKLFTEVCRAVQHAHQKGIIHRDLKPSNILITLHDGVPVVKVIDFGIAKALHHDLTEQTFFTRFAEFVGTPVYMSPEQAEMGGIDIDTRSDVYSLGVMLYKLLVGVTPFDESTLKGAGLDEMRRIIGEDEPLRPSHIISTLENALVSTISDRRGTDPRQLVLSVQSELDWIVMKTLEKDRSRRYESASELAADVSRYLADEPVQAMPPSLNYRLRKYASRHKGLLASGVLVFVSMLTGTLISIWYAAEAREAATRAQAAEAEADIAREEAEREAAIAKAVNAFLNQDLLSAANPDLEPDPNLTIRDVLDNAAQKIDGRFDDPLVESAIRLTIGEAYGAIGKYDDAINQLEGARDLRARHLGTDHIETVMSELASLKIEFLRDESPAVAERVAEVATQCRQVFGNDAEITLMAMHLESGAQRSVGHYAQAETLAREVYDRRRRLLGEEHPLTLASLYSLASAVWKLERYDEAEQLHQQVLKIRRRVLGEQHLDTIASLNNLGTIYQAQGNLDDSQRLFSKAWEQYHRVLGEDHPSTVCVQHNLGVIEKLRGNLQEAERIDLEVLKHRRRTLGEEHPATIKIMMNLANVYDNQGRKDKAEEFYRKTVEVAQRAFGSEHAGSIVTKHDLAAFYNRSGRGADEETRDLFQQSYDSSRRVLGEDHPFTLKCGYHLGIAFSNQRRYANAEEIYRQTLSRSQHVLGEKHPLTIQIANRLNGILQNWVWRLATDEDTDNRDPPKAVELGRQATRLKPGSANNWNNLGVALCRAGQWQEAVEILLKADAMIEGGDRHHRMFLAMAYWNLGEQERARESYAQGAAYIATRKANSEQQRFRAEAEELMGLSEADRRELVSQYFSQDEGKDATFFADRGKWNQSQLDPQRAIESFSKAIELEPKEATYWRLRGLQHFQLRNNEQALEDLTKVIDLKPRDEEALKARGWVRRRMGQIDLAVADMTSVIEIQPNSCNYLGRAKIYRGLQQFESALDDCQHAIDIAPDQDTKWFTRTGAYALRGDIYAENLRRYDEAMTEYSKALELQPDNQAVLEKRGKVEELLGEAELPAAEFQ